jgi:hypothetical protein
MVRLWQFAKVPGAITKYGAKFLQYHDNFALAKTSAGHQQVLCTAKVNGVKFTLSSSQRKVDKGLPSGS